MKTPGSSLALGWIRISPRFLPFADAASEQLPLGRLLRLSLFQVTVGMAIVLLIGTLNRVMIVELGVPAWLVAGALSLPLLVAPLRAIVGFRSDRHRSLLGWRRVPYIWFGTLLQFGGLAIMPFALLVLSGDAHGAKIFGEIGAALAFLLVGAGLHTTQTVGLALATDLAPAHAQPKVVALLCVMLMLGMVASALVFGACLADFSEIKLIQVVQAAALLTMVLNVVALWKQEPRDRSRRLAPLEPSSFAQAWQMFSREPQRIRSLVAVGLGTVGFSMQDVLLEPYGGQILHLTVGQTTALTALLAAGGLIGFWLAARWLEGGADPYRLAAAGSLAGLCAFPALVFAAPCESRVLFALGTGLIGFGGGLFAHATLTAAMRMARPGQIGLAMGIWGSVQASAAGLAVASGGIVRDLATSHAASGAWGAGLMEPWSGYVVVYHIEIVLLFATLVAIGPLVKPFRGGGAAPRLDQVAETRLGRSPC